MQKTLILTAAAALAFSGCTAAAPTASTTSATTESTPAYACLTVPDRVTQGIVDGKQDDVAGDLEVVDAAAVKSKEHENAYYVAAKLKIEGVDDQVGIWATSDLETGGLFSVDGIATGFTVWPKQDAMSVTDEGADAAKECLA